MPNIDLSEILSTFLSSAQSDGSVTKGLISQPEATVEKATGLSLGNINLKAIIPIAIGLLAAFAMNTGQAKTEKAAEKPTKNMTRDEKKAYAEDLTRQMKEAAKLLDFERAAYLRDKIAALRLK